MANYRSKNKFHHRDVEITKTLYGLLHCNDLPLYRQGTVFVWEAQLLEQLGLGIKAVHSGDYSDSGLITEDMRDRLLQSLKKRVERNLKRQTDEAKKAKGHSKNKSKTSLSVI